MARTTTWNEIGVSVNSTNVNDVLENANLNYEVKTQDVFTNINGNNIIVPGKQAIVRDDGYIYNVVSDKYTPIQNKDAFDYINYIDDEINFVKAGETASGLIYIIGELEKANILGDEYTFYTIFQNGHNAKYKLAMSICPLRMVCQNQFNIAFKESNFTFNIRHTKNIQTKMDIASNALKNANGYITKFIEHAEDYANKQITQNQFNKFVDNLFPIDETDKVTKVIERVMAEKQKFIKAYDEDDNQNFKGTLWGVINAMADYITHKTSYRKIENFEEKRFEQTIFVANEINNNIKLLENIAI